MEGKTSWISRAFMHLEALCMPETPFPDDCNANESTRHLLLPRPRLRFAQFGLHRELTLQIPGNYRELAASSHHAFKNQSPEDNSIPKGNLSCPASIQKSGRVRLTQIPLTRLCDSASSLLLILLQHTDLLEGLHDLAVDTSTSIDVVRWTTASVAS